jgi:hypothetical protein
MGLPFLLLFGGDEPGEIRLTRVRRLALGADTTPADARLTRVRRQVLGDDTTISTSARLTRVRRQTLGVPRPVTFENGTSIVGLTWLELTRRDGSVKVLARVPLDDPPTYYHGYKFPYVMSWGRIRRGASDWQGQFTAADLRVDCTDHTGLLRTIADEDDLANLYGVVRSIDDASRRLQLTPTTVFRGPIREDTPQPSLRYSLTLKDPLQERFHSSADVDQLPQRRVTTTDFPNAGVTAVRSSAWDYTVGANYTTVDEEGKPYIVVDGEHQSVTRVTVTGGYGCFANGDRITFGTDTQIYSVSGSSGTSVWDEIGRDPETWIDISPALQAAVSSGAAINLSWQHQVDSAVGKAVPFWYGRITDYQIVGSTDQGDGQGPLLYVGDRELPDGKVYGEFLWAGHACYSPGGKPFPAIYFWNDNLDTHVASGFFNQLHDLATEAAAGGRICIPGYANWSTTNGFGSAPYRDYNGRRYSVVFLRGIYRDWALGITGAPVNLGGVPCAIDGYGAETVGNGTGALIDNLFDQWLHCLRNHLYPANGYQGGLWRTTSPTFPDDATVSMIHDAAFATAKARSIARIGGAGYVGHWGCGPHDETIPARELLARLSLSSGADIGWTRKCQFTIDLLDDDPGTTMVGAITLTDVRDIFDQTFRPERVERELYSTLPYVHTRDFFNRAQGGWRSVTSLASDATEKTDATALAKFGTIRSPKLELHCLRANNRDGDPTYYDQGSLTVADVLARKIKRCRTTPGYVTFITGPKGLNLELFDRVWIEHFEQLGGRTARAYRIEEHHAQPDTWTVELRCRDLTHIVE